MTEWLERRQYLERPWVRSSVGAFFGDGRFLATTISTAPVTEWLERRQYLERPWVRSSLGAFFGDGGERFSATTIVTALVTESLERRQYLEAVRSFLAMAVKGSRLNAGNLS